MSSADKNLSQFTTANLPDISRRQFGIVVAEWNEEITGALYQGAVQTLLQHGARQANIFTAVVPGSYELTYGAQRYAANTHIDAVICLGCVIKGETKHDEYISNAVAQGLTNVSI